MLFIHDPYSLASFVKVNMINEPTLFIIIVDVKQCKDLAISSWGTMALIVLSNVKTMQLVIGYFGQLITKTFNLKIECVFL